jgi:hypothetical protein
MAVLEIKNLVPVVFIKHDDGTWHSAGNSKRVHVIADAESNTLTVDGVEYLVRTVEPYLVHDDPKNSFDFDHYCLQKTPGLSYATLIAFGNEQDDWADSSHRKAEYDDVTGDAWLQEFGSIEVVERYSRMGIVTIGFRAS